MRGGSLLPLRNERIPAGRGALTAPRGSAAAASGADLSADQQAKISSQHQAFDFDAAERAEMEREHEALQALLMAFLKNEDEIMKKWIALI
jgi:hypothetical protein